MAVKQRDEIVGKGVTAQTTAGNPKTSETTFHFLFYTQQTGSLESHLGCNYVLNYPIQVAHAIGGVNSTSFEAIDHVVDSEKGDAHGVSHTLINGVGLNARAEKHSKQR